MRTGISSPDVKQQKEKEMKKIYTTLFAAAAMVAAAVSCSKSESEAVSEGSGELKVNISVAPLGPDTKAIKNGWEAGDIINVWLDDTDIDKYKASDGPDFTLTYDGSKWTAAGLSGKESRLKATGGKLRGFWEASNSCFTEKGKDAGWSYYDNRDKHCHFFQFPDSDKYNRTGSKTYLEADFNGISYTYDKDSKILTADINKWHFGTDFQLVVTDISATGDKSYMLYSPRVGGIVGIENDLSGEEPLIVAYSQGSAENGCIAGIANSDGVAFVGALTNYDIGDFYLVEGARTSNEKKYKFSKENLTLSSESGSKVVALKIPFNKFTEVKNGAE